MTTLKKWRTVRFILGLVIGIVLLALGIGILDVPQIRLEGSDL